MRVSFRKIKKSSHFIFLVTPLVMVEDMSEKNDMSFLEFTFAFGKAGFEVCLDFKEGY